MPKDINLAVPKMIKSNENDNELSRSKAPRNISLLNPNLDGEGYFYLPPVCFLLITVKAVNLTFGRSK